MRQPSCVGYPGRPPLSAAFVLFFALSVVGGRRRLWPEGQMFRRFRTRDVDGAAVVVVVVVVVAKTLSSVRFPARLKGNLKLLRTCAIRCG